MYSSSVEYICVPYGVLCRVGDRNTSRDSKSTSEAGSIPASQERPGHDTLVYHIAEELFLPVRFSAVSIHFTHTNTLTHVDLRPAEFVFPVFILCCRLSIHLPPRTIISFLSLWISCTLYLFFPLRFFRNTTNYSVKQRLC